MKKHLIAVAVATAVAVPAMAQNVSVSGTLDLNLQQQYKNTVGGAAATVANGSNSAKGSGTNNHNATAGAWTTSNIAFSGSEDLGAGLKASFFLNQEVNNDAGGLAARDVWVALSGSFGSLKLGRYTPAIDGYGSYAAPGTTNSAGTSDSSGYDLMAGTIGQRQTVATMAPGATRTSERSGSFARQSGIVEFVTPTMSGFNAAVNYRANDTDDSATDALGKGKANMHALRLNYSAGALALSLATGKRKVENEAVTAVAAVAGNAGTAANNNRSGSSTASWLGASYDLGAAKLFVAHGQREDKETGNIANNAEAKVRDVKVNNIGVAIPMGAVTLTASMYDGTSKAPFTNAGAVQAGADRDLKGHQLTARYALSKRTFVYGVIGENESTDTTPAGNAAADVSKTQQYAIGLVHSF